MCSSKGGGRGGARPGAGRPPLPADVKAARLRVTQIERQILAAYKASAHPGYTISQAEMDRLDGLFAEMQRISEQFPGLRIPGGHGDWPHDIDGAIQTTGILLDSISQYVR